MGETEAWPPPGLPPGCSGPWPVGGPRASLRSSPFGLSLAWRGRLCCGHSSSPPSPPADTHSPHVDTNAHSLFHVASLFSVARCAHTQRPTVTHTNGCGNPACSHSAGASLLPCTWLHMFTSHVGSHEWPCLCRVTHPRVVKGTHLPASRTAGCCLLPTGPGRFAGTGPSAHRCSGAAPHREVGLVSRWHVRVPVLQGGRQEQLRTSPRDGRPQAHL